MDDRSRNVRVDASKALKAFSRLQTTLGKHVQVAMQENGQEFQAAMTTGITERLHARTGSLKRAPGYEVTGEGLRSQLRVFMSGVNPKIVRAQEYGGTFRSNRPGGKLTIPTDDNLTGAGRERLPSAREAIDRGAFVLRLGNGASRSEQAARQRSARRLGLGRVRQYNGAAYIVQREPNGELKFLFKLVDSVTLKPRLEFRKTFLALAPSRAARLRGAVSAGISEAFARG